MARTETVVSVLLSDPPPVLVAPALLRALDLTDREPPAWIQDADLRASIVAGFVDLPDWGTP
ncbi:hypothetical protein [Streptomyces virginiae]|uniref:hypothetical protein n=1 Tax=Streptomyces virginiae TaxID=1961 RepID=UPI0004C68A34|nr:hypothetical protein [Streptomyces virginiae]